VITKIANSVLYLVREARASMQAGRRGGQFWTNSYRRPFLNEVDAAQLHRDRVSRLPPPDDGNGKESGSPEGR
jgi:hypothetical protein